MIDIKDINGNVIQSVIITQNAERVIELMKADYVQLSWSSDEGTILPAGAYIEYKGEKFSLLEPYTPEQKDELEYEYKPQFQSKVMAWGKTPLFLYTQTESGIRKETDWVLTDNPTNFMSYIADALYKELGEQWNFAVSSDLSASATITFSTSDIYSALNAIANAFETEWWVDKEGYTIHLGKCQHGNAIDLEVGVNVKTPSITRNKEGYFTRFYAFGSTRNIEQDYEGANANNIVNKRLTLDPTKYPEGYKDIREGLKEGEIFSKVLIFDDIYPSSKLSISNVRVRLLYSLDDDNNKVQVGTDSNGNPIYDQYAIWYFQIPNFTYDKENVIEGLVPSINFKTGALAGREFEIIYHDKDKEVTTTDGEPFKVLSGDYEICFIEEGTYIIPSVTGLTPTEGDEIVLFNIKMPEEYKQSAYDELEEALDKEIARMNSDLNTYQLQSDAVAFYNDNPNLTLGQKVRYTNGAYSFETRVMKLVTKLDYECEQAITIGNEKIKGNTEQLKEEVVNANTNINFLAALNETTNSLTQAYQRTQKMMMEGFASIKDMWLFDEKDKNTIYSKFNIYSLGYVSAKGANPNTGGNEGGATTLGGLRNVAADADRTYDVAKMLVLEAKSNLWTLKNLSDLVGGLDEAELEQYLTNNEYAKRGDIPSLSGYATEQWVLGKGYATNEGVSAELAKYLPLSGGTLTGHITLPNKIYIRTESNSYAILGMDGNKYILAAPNKPTTIRSNGTLKHNDAIIWDSKTLTNVSQLTNDANYATTSDLDNRIDALVNGAPAAYDTLKEIADVLAGNVNSISDILTALGNKADKATTLSGYGITDAYTIAQIDSIVNGLSVDISTLEGYFTDGVANSALKLSDNGSYTAWGQTFFTNGKPKTLSGALTDVTDITSSGTITTNKIVIGNGTIEWDETNKGFKIVGGLYTESYLSAKGANSSGGSSSGGGLITSLYRYADLGKTFSDTNNDTFNAYTINKINADLGSRISVLEGKATNVSFTQSLTSGTQIGSISIDGVAKNIYAPTIPTDDINKGVTAYGWGNHANVGYAMASALSAYQTKITSSNKLDYSLISGVPTNLSQFTDDVVSGKYLPLSGGTISGTTTRPLIIKTSSSYIETQYVTGNKVSLYIGWSNNEGVFLQEGNSSKYIGIKTDGTPYYHDGTRNTLIHSGNYTDYTYSKSTIDTKLGGYLPLSGGTMTGTILIGAYTSFGVSGDSFYLGSPSYPLLIRSNGDAKVNGNTIIHSGNIGSQSVNYATNSRYIEVQRISDYKDIGNSNVGFNWHDWNNISGDGLSSYNYGIRISSGDANIFSYVGFYYGSSSPYIRTIGYSSDSGWKQLAFIDDNVASATTAASITINYATSDAKFPLLFTNQHEQWESKSDSIYRDNTSRLGYNPYNDILYANNIQGSGISPYITDKWNDGTNDNYWHGLSIHAVNSIYNTVLSGYYGVTLKTGGGIMALANSGNVGIGTTNPQYKLDVNGTFRASGAWSGYDPISILEKTNNTYSLLHIKNTVDNLQLGLQNDGVGLVYLTGNHRLDFATNSLTRMTITADGNVGIGTPDPTKKLHIYSTSSGYNDMMTLEKGGAYDVRINLINTVDEFRIIQQASGNAYISLNGNHPMIFETSNTERMRIEGNGNVGIGTTSPEYKLDVNGVIHSNTGIFSDGYVSAKGQNTSSDMRLKNVLGEVVLGVKDIANAPSVRFAWKNGGGVDVGSSAQYWQGLLPDAVKERDGMLEMQYANIALLSAIAIAKNVETHEERIARLEKENKELRTKIDMMERGIA